MAGRGADRPAKPGTQAIDRLAAGGEGGQDGARFEAPSGRVERQDVEADLPDEVIDPAIGARIGQENLGVAGEAARLAQVREHRDVGGAAFDAAGELRHREDRDVQFARQPLQPARDLRDLLHAVVAALRALHQLEVIDLDEVQPVFGLEPPRLRAQFHDADTGGIVDEDLQLGELAEGAGDALPLLVVDDAEAQPVRVDAGLHREEALDELLGGHLQVEDRDRLAGLCGGVGETQGETGLAHAGASGEDDEIAVLEAAGELVEVHEAGRDADDLAAVLLQEIELVEVGFEHLGDRDEIAPAAILRDIVDRPLGGVERLVDFEAFVVADVDDLRPGADDPAQHGGPLNDLPVVFDVDGGRDSAHQGGERRVAADVL